MLVLLSILLLLVDSHYALQCVTNCSVDNLRFDQALRIPDGQCLQRTSAYQCSMEVDFRYDQRKYSAMYGQSSVSRDYIYITSGPYLLYSIAYSCSKDTNCPLAYAQNRISEMTGRAYDAPRIYGQIAPLIENTSRNGSIQCYNMKNDIVTCPAHQLCVFAYDTRAKRITTRDCQWESVTRVAVFDSESYGNFDFQCARNLCNDEETFEKIKAIFVNNGLTDTDGRRIAGGTKEMASILLITFAFVSSVFRYF